MPDANKVIKGLRDARRYLEDKEWSDRGASPHIDAINDALELLKEQQEQIDKLIEESASNAEMAEGLRELLKEQMKQIKALRLLVEWAERTLEGHGAFEEGR